VAYKREMISARTKAALAEPKARGTEVDGCRENAARIADYQAQGVETIKVARMRPDFRLPGQGRRDHQGLGHRLSHSGHTCSIFQRLVRIPRLGLTASACPLFVFKQGSKVKPSALPGRWM
jgi:hypothetical protein